MNILFSHAGHSHDMTQATGFDHCAPIIIIAGIIIVVLAGVIVYLIANTEPKKTSKTKNAKK